MTSVSHLIQQVIQMDHGLKCKNLRKNRRKSSESRNRQRVLKIDTKV